MARHQRLAIIIAAAVLLPVLFMGQTLLFGRPLVRDDAGTQFYPQFESYARCLQANDLYLWDPYQWCGLPAMGTGQSGGLYPLHLLAFRLIPWQAAIHLCYWLHLAAALLGFMWVAKNFGASRGAAVVGALIYTFSGFAAAHLIHYNFITAQAHMMLLLAVLQTALLRQSWRWWGLLGLEIALMFLCVQPQLLLMALFLGLLWLVAGGWWRNAEPPRSPWPATIGGLATATVLAVLLCLPQLLAVAELARLSGSVAGQATDGEAGASFISSYPYRLADVPRIVFPNLFGDIHSSFTGTGPVFHETSAFVGVAVLMLAAAGLVLARRRRGYWFLVVVLVAGALLMISSNPLYGLLARLPVLGGFRAMGRWVIVPIFSLAMLTTLGLSELPAAGERALKTARGAAWLVAALVLLPLILLWLTFGMEGGGLAIPGSGATIAPETLSRVIFNWLVGWEPLLVIAGAVGALGAIYAASKYRLCLLLALIATGLPLWHYWQTVYEPGPRDYYERPTATAQAVQSSGGRMTTLPPELVSPDWLTYIEPSDRADLSRELLTPVYGLVFGLSYADGYRHRLSTPATYRLWEHYYRYGTQAFTGRMTTTPEALERYGTAAERMKRMHLLSGVQCLVTPGTLDDPDLPVSHDGPVKVYRYETEHPQAWMVGQTVVAADPEAQLETIKLRSFNPLTTAVVDQDVPGLPGRAVTGTATIHRRYNETYVTTNADSPALLVLADAWYPGWHATVDGQPATLLRANYAFRAVAVPAGPHQVIFRYRPAYWLPSLALMALGLVLLALCVAGPALRRRAR